MVSRAYEMNPEYPPPKAGEPALHRAARTGDHDALRALIVAGADLEEVFDLQLDPGARPTSATPLLVACGAADATVETVRLLLEAGADPFATPGEQTALRFAAAGLGWNYPPGGDADRMALLLELGLDPHHVDLRGVSLVAEASWEGDLARVELLLAAGASPDAAPGAPGFDIPDGLADLLPPGLALPVAGPDSALPFQIPLFGAVAAGDRARVELLLAAGARPDLVDQLNGRTAMFAASDVGVVEALVRGGLDTEARDIFGWTPLCAAASDGNAAAVRALLRAGAEPNSSSDRGYTAFMHAAGARSVEAITALVDGGADPHAVSELGWNAVHATVDTNSSDPDLAEATFRALFELGVDFGAPDRHGRTPLERAQWEGTDLERDLLARYTSR